MDCLFWYLWPETRLCCYMRCCYLFALKVRVPTHRKGTSMFWEFATDSYDIGFGVYFEWNIEPPTQVTVQVSESSDEEDLDEEYPEGNTVAMLFNAILLRMFVFLV